MLGFKFWKKYIIIFIVIIVIIIIIIIGDTECLKSSIYKNSFDNYSADVNPLFIIYK